MSETAVAKKGLSTREITYIAICAVLLAACSWISIPTVVPFTLQTFGVFLVLLLLGGRRGFLAILTFILLGAMGAPVFANFSGGIGILFGSTGGYIIGFLFTALIYWALERVIDGKPVLQIAALVLGLAVCYTFGTAWFMVVYARQSGPIGLATALGWCVLPFIVPDLVKLGLAWALSAVLKKHVNL